MPCHRCHISKRGNSQEIREKNGHFGQNKGANKGQKYWATHNQDSVSALGYFFSECFLDYWGCVVRCETDFV